MSYRYEQHSASPTVSASLWTAALRGGCDTSWLSDLGIVVSGRGPRSQSGETPHAVLALVVADTGWLRARRHVFNYADSGRLSLTRSVSQGMYRFDWVQFVRWTMPVDGRTIDHIVSVHGDHAGGLWAIGEHEIFHLKGGSVVSHFALESQLRTDNASADAGRLLVDSGRRSEFEGAPLSRKRPRREVFRRVRRGYLLRQAARPCWPTGKGSGLGQRAVAHWRHGVSRVYPIEALKTNSDDGVNALALDSDGTLWLACCLMARGRDLEDWRTELSSLSSPAGSMAASSAFSLCTLIVTEASGWALWGTDRSAFAEMSWNTTGERKACPAISS